MSHFSPVSFMCKFFFKNCRALAKNCNAPINDKTGAEAKDWKGGKPVRVVRNCKGRKHSKYAPEEGNRYDGIYKVIALWFSCTICTISLKDGWGVYKEKLLDQILFLTFLIAFYKLFFSSCPNVNSYIFDWINWSPDCEILGRKGQVWVPGVAIPSTPWRPCTSTMDQGGSEACKGAGPGHAGEKRNIA